MQPAADRNLLFGVLAVQMDFISRDQLIAAMHAWVLHKARPLGDILVEQRALSAERYKLLDALVGEHLKQHGCDPQKSLAAVSSASSVRNDLEQIADADVRTSLTQLGTTDPHAHHTPAVGTPTSSGLRFRILRPHAKGGLGEVFVARDEELHREVALKEIQDRHADNQASRTRFLLEAEITGGLEHPGIVPVYGLGQYADGRPFYAMRFIRGDSLKEAIEGFHARPRRESANVAGRVDFHALPFHKLLRRLIDVCNAIQYAHDRGVLHRDLKPGNIMLGKYGETLVVDWGLAKAAGKFGDPEVIASTDEQTLRPASGSGSADTIAGNAIGTPAFMSPEQAEGRLDLLGPATDVYSLGATLYCLLTGKAPVEDNDMAKVRRGEFPRPRQLKPEVDPALEAICLKAMALNRADRYVSPRALADDLENWLADEPTIAYREPVSVRARRWARKHRTLVASSAAALLVAAAGSIAATLLLAAMNNQLESANSAERDQRQRAEQNEKKADDQRERAEASYRLAREALGKCMELKNDPRLQSGEMQKLQVMLAQAEATFYQQFVQLRGEEPAFQAERAHAFYALAKVTDLLGKTEEAVGNCKQAVVLYDELLRGDSAQSAYREKLVTCFGTLAGLYGKLNQWKDSEPASDEALANANVLNRSNPENPSYQLLVAQAQNQLGIVYRFTNRLEKAEKSHQAAIEILEKLAKLHPTPDNRRHLAEGYVYLGGFYAFHSRGRLSKAQDAYEQALKILEELVREAPSEAAEDSLSRLYRPLAGLCKMTRKFSAAEDLITQKALPFLTKRAHRHPAVADYQLDLAAIYAELSSVDYLQDHLDKSLASCTESLAICTRLALQDPAVTNYLTFKAQAETQMGNIKDKQGKRQEAVEWFGKAIGTVTAARVQGKNAKIILGTAYASRAGTLMAIKRYAEAVKDWEGAIEMHEMQVTTSLLRGHYRGQRAVALARAGDHSKATAEVELLIREVPPRPDSLFFYARIYALAQSGVLKDDSRPGPEREKLARQYAGRAVQLLTQAQGAGYFKEMPQLKKMSEDEDLGLLRTDERYQEFFRKLRLELNREN